ncbi:carbohydrate esterase family 5 protein [Venturia nashicola]|uniref:Cutinase n=1 Tax=Venturia nashicola TaxID=86259 RepID=A0A4Z1PJB5_9PEZI|nr:carbohydrate esterase family 5 protein [Venturia nashicola]TLD35021.1 carbohydrate esterase family 5 protein [Venturia nashicola]
MTKFSTIFCSLLTLSSARVIITKRTASIATDVTDGVCKPITLIFARGTTEPGNMGLIVGPPLAAAMQTTFGADKVAIQGVDYLADIPGAASGALAPQDAAGAKTMIALIKTLTTACPTTKIVLSGYSQGAEQVRGALGGMTFGSSEIGMVRAVVTFGDPLRRDEFLNIEKERTRVNCVGGDLVCDELFVVSAAHLSYGANGDVEGSVGFVGGVLGM